METNSSFPSGGIISVPNSIAYALQMNEGASSGNDNSLKAINDNTRLPLNLFWNLASAAFFMTCVEMGLGFAYALERQRTSSLKMLRILGLIAFAVMVIMAVTCTGLDGSLLKGPTGSLYGGWMDRLDQTNNLITAKTSIYLFLNIVNLVQAARIKHRYRDIGPSRQVGQPISVDPLAPSNSHVLLQTVTLYLVATVLAVVNNAWALVYRCLIIYGYSNDLANTYVGTVTSLIFGSVPWFVAVVLLFCVAVRRHDGLWTTLQPWMNGVEPSLTSGLPHHHHQTWYGQQQQMYNPIPMYPPPGNAMYQPQPQQLGPNLDPYELQSKSAPLEAPGHEVAHMVPNREHYHPAKQDVVYEMRS